MPQSKPEGGTPRRSVKMRRALVRALIVVLATWGAWWWFTAPPPAVGGGQSDGLVAAWLKSRVYASVPPPEERGFERLTPQNANNWYVTFAEPIQTLQYYQSQQPTRPTEQRRTLVLQPLGPIHPQQHALLRDLESYCSAFFQLPARTEKPLPLPPATEFARDSGRRSIDLGAGTRQYDAGQVVDKHLAPRLPPDAAAYLGITMTDLYAGDFSYVFGLGSFEQRSGVYSLARYYAQFWGRPTKRGDDTRLLRRACLVLSHEAGHMFGLYHCVLYKCAMNGSNSLNDADNTPLHLCPICQRKLAWNIGYNRAKRTKDLEMFYRKHGL